jgi:hypothetical protein
VTRAFIDYISTTSQLLQATLSRSILAFLLKARLPDHTESRYLLVLLSRQREDPAAAHPARVPGWIGGPVGSNGDRFCAPGLAAQIPAADRVGPAILVGAQRDGQTGKLTDLVISEQRGGKYVNHVRTRMHLQSSSCARGLRQEKLPQTIPHGPCPHVCGQQDLSKALRWL